jgi:hypothetical protein
MRPTIDDLVRMAALAGLVIPRADLERLLPPVALMYEDLDRLRALPIARVEPAFTPEPRTVEVSGGERRDG